MEMERSFGYLGMIIIISIELITGDKGRECFGLNRTESDTVSRRVRTVP